MTLTKLYIKAVICPSVWVVILAVIFGYVESRGYQSEWFTANSGIWMGLGIGIVFSVIICIAALPIFLINYKPVFQSKVLVFGAWFVLPFGIMGFYLTDNLLRKIRNGALLEFDSLLLVILTLPFLIGLIRVYVQFIRNDNTVSRID